MLLLLPGLEEAQKGNDVTAPWHALQPDYPVPYGAPKKEAVKPVSKGSFFSYLHYWKKSPVMYRKVVTGLLLFALFNSSDVFLLLKMKEAGWGDSAVIMAFIWYNLIYALFALPAGILADKIGLKKTFLIGLVLFAAVYFVMSFRISLVAYFVLFFIYGMYAAATEGIAKAWISNIASRDDTATAIGMFSGFQSICLFIASSLTGLIWYKFGPVAAFVITSGIAIIVAVYFLLLKEFHSAKGEIMEQING